MTMRTHASIAKAYDLTTVSFALPDLGSAAGFLSDFGISNELIDGNLVGRGHDGVTIYTASKTDNDEATFVGFGIALNSIEELAELARLPGAETDANDHVTLLDPNGWRVALSLADRASEENHVAVTRNEGGATNRPHVRLSIGHGPSKVRRLGHVVLQVRDFVESLNWYQETFGLLVSDFITAPEMDQPVAAFLRCDRGANLTDHHSVFLMQSPDGIARFEHAAFEVNDIDGLMAGSDHLAKAGHEKEWGVGRHILGAHIFDYWKDPFGFTLEHWVDGDLLDASDPPGKHGFSALLDTQWGPRHAMMENAQ